MHSLSGLSSDSSAQIFNLGGPHLSKHTSFPNERPLMPQPPIHPDAFRRLLQVMSALRGESGCPWDKKQTHQTLVPFLVEEAYELIEAIEQADQAAIREELGDVLLQVVFHAQIAKDAGTFDMDDIAGKLADKLIERHPHVFSNPGENPQEKLSDQPKTDPAEAVRQSWHTQKMAHKKSALEGIPTGQPALYWARQVGSRAAQAGFEWDRLEQIFNKVREELAEVEDNLSMPDGEHRQNALEDELGDLLFAATQLARWLKVDPEAALRRAVRKFSGRFQRMEAALHERIERSQPSNKVEWRDLWDQAKREAGD